MNQYDSVDSTGYSYDNNGNLTDDGVYNYIYDVENRLVKIYNDQNENDQYDSGIDIDIADYTYDYAGRRIAKVTANVTTTYCYDGDQVIAEYENGTLVRKFIYGPGIDEPIIMIVKGTPDQYYFYHFDGLGSVVALSDENGDIKEKYTYEAFGQTTIHSPGPDELWNTSDDDSTLSASAYDNPYMFTGRRLDDETGLYYYRARMYHPELGRFMQTDPIGYLGGINLYAYVGNNPINWIDPLGLLEYDLTPFYVPTLIRELSALSVVYCWS